MVVVFGSINADLVATVAVLPREGETRTASGYAVHAGGKGANQALAARRAGARVTLVGAVGRDGFAEIALGTLRDAGVDLSGVAISNQATGIALIHVDAQGRNTITVVPGDVSSATFWIALAAGTPGADIEIEGVGLNPTRTAMIEVADQDFVKTARAKGIGEGQVARRHILRNALVPLISFAGL